MADEQTFPGGSNFTETRQQRPDQTKSNSFSAGASVHEMISNLVFLRKVLTGHLLCDRGAKALYLEALSATLKFPWLPQDWLFDSQGSLEDRLP